MFNKLTVLPPACHREVEVGFEKGIMLWEMKDIYIYMDKIFVILCTESKANEFDKI